MGGRDPCNPCGVDAYGEDSQSLWSRYNRLFVGTTWHKLVAALLRVAGVTVGLAKSNVNFVDMIMAAYRRVYDLRHLQADCQEPDQLRNHTLGNRRVWATFTFFNMA